MNGTPLTPSQKDFIQRNRNESIVWLAEMTGRHRSTIYTHIRGLQRQKQRYSEGAVYQYYFKHPDTPLTTIARRMGLSYGMVRRSIEMAFAELRKVPEPDVALQGYGTYTYNCTKLDCAWCQLVSQNK
jgi:hypothetical protein